MRVRHNVWEFLAWAATDVVRPGQCGTSGPPRDAPDRHFGIAARRAGQRRPALTENVPDAIGAHRWLRAIRLRR